MSVRRAGEAFRRCQRSRYAAIITVIPASFLVGCSCLIGDTSAAYRPRSSFQLVETPSLRRSATVVLEGTNADSKHYSPPSHLLKNIDSPNCEIEGVKKPPTDSGAAGANADQELLDAARLEIERDCFKDAERKVRQQLEELQNSVSK